MKKCILLVRVSTIMQDLVQQTEKVRDAAIRDGYKEESIIIIEDKESAVKGLTYSSNVVKLILGYMVLAAEQLHI